tara:strand:+ start:211 stop:870 length:660 start_codon:yes stop_codon:yes gene_type:complete
MKAMTLLSGGMDSATVLYYMINTVGKANCCAVSFQYPSKHNKYELLQGGRLCAFAGVQRRVIDVTSLFDEFESNLLQTGGAIPEGHYESETMKQTVIPNRNMIFSSIAAGLAESLGIDQLWLGIHSGDHAIYPDCRPEFFNSLKQTLKYSTDGKVDCVAPFLDGDKTTILNYGHEHGVPYAWTRTCYKDQDESCGKCGACQERLEAFANIGKEDPVEYA